MYLHESHCKANAFLGCQEYMSEQLIRISRLASTKITFTKLNGCRNFSPAALLPCVLLIPLPISHSSIFKPSAMAGIPTLLVASRSNWDTWAVTQHEACKLGRPLSSLHVAIAQFKARRVGLLTTSGPISFRSENWTVFRTSPYRFL